MGSCHMTGSTYRFLQVNDLWAELEKAEERLANGEARATMLENIEITRLSRQLQKTAQDLSNLKNDYMEIKPASFSFYHVAFRFSLQQ